MADHQKNSDSSEDEVLLYSSFYLGETLCGINIANVQEINEDLNITKVPLSPDYVEGIMNLRGQIVTIINQSMKIGFPASQINKESRVVIVKSKEENVGLLVDRVTEVVSVTRKEIAEPPPNIKGVQGRFFEGVLHTEGNELMGLLNVEEVLVE